MFTIGEELTVQELVERLGISINTWNSKKKKYIEHLREYYDVEIIGNGKSRRYKIVRQLQEYEPLISKKDKEAIEYTYKKVILEEIQKSKMNLQLYSTMNQRIYGSVFKKFGHKEGTSYKYTSKELKELFGAEEGQSGSNGEFVKKVWARRIYDGDYDFEGMEGEELSDWLKILKETFQNNDAIVDTYTAFFNEEINEEEARDIIWIEGKFKYQRALIAFDEKYGYQPVKVRKYLIRKKELD